MDNWGAFTKQLRQKTPTIWFLGSGCSVSSGIPTGADLAKQWASELFEQSGRPTGEFGEWCQSKLGTSTSSISGEHFATLASMRFSSDDEKGRVFYDLSIQATPSLGYAVLTTLLLRHRGDHHVITTNFDDLVQDSLHLFHNQRGLVISSREDSYLEGLRRDLPRIVKLHGDHKVLPRVEKDELREVEEPLSQIATRLCGSGMVVFLGYGGYDTGVTRMLSQLTRQSVPLGVYWLSRNDRAADGDDLARWLQRVGARYVRISTFDETMLQIARLCRIPVSTSAITRRARTVSSRLRHALSEECRLEHFVSAPADARISFPRLPLQDLESLVRLAVAKHPSSLAKLADPDLPEDARSPARAILFGLRRLACEKPEAARELIAKVVSTPFSYEPYRHWAASDSLRTCLADLAWTVFKLGPPFDSQQAETAAWGMLVRLTKTPDAISMARLFNQNENNLPRLDKLISRFFTDSRRHSNELLGNIPGTPEVTQEQP